MASDVRAVDAMQARIDLDSLDDVTRGRRFIARANLVVAIQRYTGHDAGLLHQCATAHMDVLVGVAVMTWSCSGSGDITRVMGSQCVGCLNYCSKTRFSDCVLLVYMV